MLSPRAGVSLLRRHEGAEQAFRRPEVGHPIAFCVPRKFGLPRWLALAIRRWLPISPLGRDKKRMIISFTMYQMY
ncbi:MAG: hypothetical protein ACK5O9_05980 [Holosporales bacterium]|jgi:hypothetical protein